MLVLAVLSVEAACLWLICVHHCFRPLLVLMLMGAGAGGDVCCVFCCGCVRAAPLCPRLWEGLLVC
jgi:hypothetical protein